jgi:hypothetical protein
MSGNRTGTMGHRAGMIGHRTGIMGHRTKWSMSNVFSCLKAQSRKKQ